MLFQLREEGTFTQTNENTMSTAVSYPGLLVSPVERVASTSTRMRVGFIAACLATIAVISATDIWFAVANSTILYNEKNPICLELIKLDPHGFTYFVLGKSAGTLTVLFTLLQLHMKGYRHAMKVTIIVTCFQLGLLTYLTLSDPKLGHLPNFSLLFNETAESIWNLK